MGLVRYWPCCPSSAVSSVAILKVPGLEGREIDLSLLRPSVQTFDPWFVGVIGAAGVLTAIVPGSMILMTRDLNIGVVALVLTLAIVSAVTHRRTVYG